MSHHHLPDAVIKEFRICADHALTTVKEIYDCNVIRKYVDPSDLAILQKQENVLHVKEHTCLKECALDWLFLIVVTV